MTDRLPVALTFDFDAETLWLSRDPESGDRPVWLSQGRYGALHGVPRILDLLERHGIPATFFIPGLVVEMHPDACAAIVAAGHEIAHHSHTHTWPERLTPELERDEFERGLEALEALSGHRPQGWRSPSGEFTAHTLPLLEELGFAYSSNMFDADAPYLLRDGDRATGIVELPFAWALDDAPFFLYSNRLPGRSMAAPSAVLETWTLEFDGLASEAERSMVIAMHPQVIGRPSRMWVLERFVRHVVDSGRGRFVSCGELAGDARERLER
jgi:peptidoglycan/xylan/chitin deacetylase (PgdA/CDA1 family)